MSDFYHFFGIKDVQNRFMMRLVNPFGFNITTAQIKLQELFSTHGVCPASNEVTWSPWVAGKTIYQLWNVTPNKLGLIRSATPTLTLDGVNYKGLFTYLLSLDDYTNVYTNDDDFPSRWSNNVGGTISGKVSDFVPVSIGELDTANMTGIFMNLKSAVAYNWDVISPWIDNGNIFIDANASILTNAPFSSSYIATDIGDYSVIVLNETELSPIYNKPASFTFGGNRIRFYNLSPPGGWTARVIAEMDVSAARYSHVIEFVHDASGGRYIGLEGYNYYTCMPDWWYPIVALQYPLMKLASVAAYYTE